MYYLETSPVFSNGTYSQVTPKELLLCIVLSLDIVEAL